MMLPFCRELIRCGLRRRTAQPTIKAGIARAIYRNGLAVNVRDRNFGEIVHSAVVEEAAGLPVTPFITDAIIAKAVVYSAIKADAQST